MIGEDVAGGGEGDCVGSIVLKVGNNPEGRGVGSIVLNVGNNTPVGRCVGSIVVIDGPSVVSK